VRRDYLDKAGFESLLAAAGVTPDTTVAPYGGNNNWLAAYAYWLLKYRGFDSVKLLDGGRKIWALKGLPITTDSSTYAPTDFRISGVGRPELRALHDDIVSAARQSTLYVDVRSPEEFTGEKLAPDHLPQEQPYVGGHIPGAINIPWSKAANDDGTFRSAAEPRELYAGVLGGGEVVAYCRIGERS
jgi:thiosulfate/3-mercaptopyruvate sulfurtransferase